MLTMTLDDRAAVHAIEQLAALLSPVGLQGFLSSTVGPYLSKRAKERFESEGDDVTGRWAPLKEATVTIRSDLGFGGAHPINRRTGELEEWVVQGGWDAYPQMFGASLRYPRNAPIGELRDKVETAQKGKSEPSTVKRPVLGVNEKDMIFVLAALAAGIKVSVR